MKIILCLVLTISLAAMPSYADVLKPGSYYVTSDNLNVRLEANKGGKITNTLNRDQKVEVFEVTAGWARISEYYNGATEGITGDVARWVSVSYLSSQQPLKDEIPSSESPLVKAIATSDNYKEHQTTFISASEGLIENGTCKLQDFEEMGGWFRSSTHKPKPIFFTYCSGKKANDRIYLDTQTAKIFR